MRLAAEDHVVHVAMTDVIFFLHCTIPFSFSLTRLLYARANEKLYEKGQQSAMGLSRDKITVCVYKGYIGKGRKEPDPLRAG